MIWTWEREQEMRSLWNAGFSGLEIARHFRAQLKQPVSREMIMGKVQRMGLKDGHRESALQRKILPKPKPIPLPKREPEPEPMPTGVTMENVAHGQCRFPTWGHYGPVGNMPVCGRGVEAPRIYCADHARLCFAKRGEAEDADDQ